MDLVIRFNKLQSYVCGDKFDVWASRHGDAVSTRYWGIGTTSLDSNDKSDLHLQLVFASMRHNIIQSNVKLSICADAAY